MQLENMCFLQQLQCAQQERELAAAVAAAERELYDSWRARLCDEEQRAAQLIPLPQVALLTDAQANEQIGTALQSLVDQLRHEVDQWSALVAGQRDLSSERQALLETAALLDELERLQSVRQSQLVAAHDRRRADAPNSTAVALLSEINATLV